MATMAQLTYWAECYKELCSGLKLKRIPHRHTLAREIGEELTAKMAYFNDELNKANTEIDWLRGRSVFGRIRAVFIPSRRIE